MKNENRLKAACREIMENFNQPEEKLQGFFCDSIKKEHEKMYAFIEKFYEKFGGDKGTDLENMLADFETAMESVSFSLGYVFGQMFDIPCPKIQKNVEAIKVVMKKENLLSYLPREKKGGSHEKEN